MNQQKSLIRISELLSRFKIQVNILNSNAQLDINIVAEDVLIPMFNIAYDCELVNAKYSEADSRFPALDLLDKTKKIAIQVTSTSDIKKIKKTLEGILNNKFHEQFKTFYIYIITQKQKSYSQESIDDATKNIYHFNIKNILDEKDLYQKIASLGYDKILKIEKLLELQFADIIIEKNIENKIGDIIDDMDINYQKKFYTTKLKGLHETKLAWLNKKKFFEGKLVSISDINQEFSILNQLETINIQIENLNNQISNILNLNNE